ncbi:hypothetical protein TA3x_001753 [Tundrisphaera sp. TA3]|uniref:hypothetical protein n=1 Tax=Tundrisphaera sp. TA3 TaxID=3435775 RepID=UPI003EBE9BEF
MSDERAGSERNPAMPWDLLDRGDPGFVDVLRGIHDADALADFALGWYQDDRPAARRLLHDYLGRPLNAFRHEGLVKRLFKLAEVARDDATMARFLVLFDRSIRRSRRKKARHENRRVANRAEADALLAEWKPRGFRLLGMHQPRPGGIVQILGYWPDEVIVQPRGTDMPRDRKGGVSRWDAQARRLVPPDAPNPIPPAVPDWADRFRLFSVSTRKYLRRRSWRYLRNLGRQQPGRYVAAAREALLQYRDEDAPDGLALLDNWGLVHILFHDSPALVAGASGWAPAEGRSLADLAPAPAFAALWDEAPRAVVDLLGRAPSRTVRQWAIRRIREHPDGVAAAWPVAERIDLLGHADPDVVALAAEWLGGVDGLDALGFDRWLELVVSTSPDSLDLLCDLVRRHVRPQDVSAEQAAELASRRPAPLARLGLDWLRARPLGEPAADALLTRLLEAECPSARVEILAWLRESLARLPEHRADRALRFLDSRHADARAEGWRWFLADPTLHQDVGIWRKLAETPHDDVRIALLADLEKRAGGGDPSRLGLDPGSLRPMWASVLLNVHRGNRAKPVAVRQIVQALRRNPDAAPDLLPLLGVALRSVRGPERRAGLAAVVQLVEKKPGVEPLARSSFPELAWS